MVDRINNSVATNAIESAKDLIIKVSNYIPVAFFTKGTALILRNNTSWYLIIINYARCLLGATSEEEARSANPHLLFGKIIYLAHRI